MPASPNRLILAALAAAALLAGPEPEARAQAVGSLQWGYLRNPYRNVASQSNVVPVPVAVDYPDPYTGIANLVRAQGQFIIDQQQGVLAREQIIAERIKNRRAKIEQYLWERDNLPTLQDERERTQRLEERRALDPPPTEIWSAKSLNDLLGLLKKHNSPGRQYAAMPVSEEVLSQINVTSGRNGGNIGLIKDGRISFWPILLQRKDFAPQRQHIDKLLAQVVKQAEKGEVDGEAVWQMIQAATELEKTLTQRARQLADDGGQQWTPGMYMDAKRFVAQLDDALKVLQEKDASQYLLGKIKLKARTLAELVKEMEEKGLAFAPATPGTHRAYNALHAALADYARDAGLIIIKTK